MWSDPMLVSAESIARGKAVSHAGETRTLSRTLLAGSLCLLVQVKRAPSRLISLRPNLAIKSLNMWTLGQAMFLLFLPSLPLIKLKSPATCTGRAQVEILCSSSSRKAGDRA